MLRQSRKLVDDSNSGSRPSNGKLWLFRNTTVVSGGSAFNRLPLLHSVEHFAGLAAIIIADNAIFGHIIDQAGSPAVANA